MAIYLLGGAVAGALTMARPTIATLTVPTLTMATLTMAIYSLGGAVAGAYACRAACDQPCHRRPRPGTLSE